MKPFLCLEKKTFLSLQNSGATFLSLAILRSPLYSVNLNSLCVSLCLVYMFSISSFIVDGDDFVSFTLAHSIVSPAVDQTMFVI